MSLLGQIANKEIYNFLRTTTIKNSYFADKSRTLQVRSTITDRVPDIELPYYKHVAGEYILKDVYTAYVTHPKTGAVIEQKYGNTTPILRGSDSLLTTDVENGNIYTDDVFDEMMTVTSLDTQEEIPFTLQNLHADYADDPTSVHTKTLEAYKLPGRYFELLCERYPNQVDLIKAIVYPVESAREITDAEQAAYDLSREPLPTLSVRRREFLVAADNLTVLNYDEEILDEQERTSITSKLKQFTALINERWSIKEFCYEENYSIVLWSVLWSLLPLVLIAQRYSNIRTPEAHSSHIWDFLISKGLESYKGYLTKEQTLFLYKNIEYIINHSGQQKITNLLIDELLSDVGLNIKTKTIVLDTTDTCPQDTSSTGPTENFSTQCEACSKREWCHKNITTHVCSDRVAIDDLCKAEPIVLTEEFAGASEAKILSALQSQYGYTEEEAKKKYQRSKLWKDDQIEDIKSSLNRDQLTDLSGETEPLSDLIAREYTCGLEPVYNDDVVEQQRNDLRHMAGTYAPTKILEMTKNTYNAKFARLFAKFLTETLLHLAPKDVDGSQETKVSTTYSFQMKNDSTNYIANYGELLACLYLGTTREYLIELFYDHVNTDETYQADTTYYIKVNETDITGNNTCRLTKLNNPVVGTTVADNVYRWAPKLGTLPTELSSAAGHEFVTNFMTNPNFVFPIPDQVKLTIAFKFGKPVKQQELIDAWLTDSGEYSSKLNLTGYAADKVLKLGDYLYGVRETQAPETPYIWEDVDVGSPLELTGVIVDDVYYPDIEFVVSSDTEATHDSTIADPYYYTFEDNTYSVYITTTGNILPSVVYTRRIAGEIPIIPRYFRWYNEHMCVDSETVRQKEVSVEYYEDGALLSDSSTSTTTPTLMTEVHKFDKDKGQTYLKVEMDSCLNVDSLIEQYVDLPGKVTEQSVIGAYITSMFTMLQNLHTFAGCSGSIKVNLAVTEFMKATMHRSKYYKVNLTGASRFTKWPTDEVHQYALETSQINVATYEDWFKLNKDLSGAFENVDSSTDAEEIWNTFNSTCLELLTEGCTLPYVSLNTNDTTVEKLKELVTHLSSYKVTFVDVANDERTSDPVEMFVSDSSATKLTGRTYVYVSPIGMSDCVPHAGGYMLDTTGDYYVHTLDESVVEGKTYYVAVNTHTSTSGGPSEIDLGIDTVSYVAATGMTVGETLLPRKYFEKINFYTLLGISDTSLMIDILCNNRKWYYRTGEKTDNIKEVPASQADNELVDSEGNYVKDEFLEGTAMTHITDDVKAKFYSYKYRKYVDFTDYEWSEYQYSEVLSKWLNGDTTSHTIVDKTTVANPIIGPADND